MISSKIERGVIEWAEYSFLAKPEVLLFSSALVNIEMKLKRARSDALHLTRRFEYPWVYMSLKPCRDDVFLDAGGGEASLQFFMADKVKEFHNLDLDRDCIEGVNKVKRAERLNSLFFLVGDVANMPLASCSFDKTACISTLEHMPVEKISDGIDELIRVTKCGGKIAITMDVPLEETDKQLNWSEFMGIVARYSLTVPPLPSHVMVVKTPPYNFPFTVACILINLKEVNP